MWCIIHFTGKDSEFTPGPLDERCEQIWIPGDITRQGDEEKAKAKNPIGKPLLWGTEGQVVAIVILQHLEQRRRQKISLEPK